MVTKELDMTKQLSVQEISFSILIHKIFLTKTPSLFAHPTWLNGAAAVFLTCGQVPGSHLGSTTGCNEGMVLPASPSIRSDGKFRQAVNTSSQTHNSSPIKIIFPFYRILNILFTSKTIAK
jgi:hypothetical protein